MRLFVDLTCAWAEAGRIAHGTLRVERGLARAFLALGETRVRFTRFDSARGDFVELTDQDAAAMLDAAPRAERRRGGRPSWRQGGLFAAGRLVERWVRERLRAPLRRWIGRWRTKAAGERRGRSAQSIFRPGDVLFLPGELRQDQQALRALRDRGIRLALLFYDLLDTLPDGDPRLGAAARAKLPSSDFMALHGDVMFSISRHSAAIFARHLARRHVAPRPVGIIRLASDLDPETRQQACVGLAPGEFILCVGDVNARKNQSLLVDVWRQSLRHGVALPVLVIAGRVDGAAIKLRQDVAADPALASLILFKPNVTDAKLAWLYGHCLFSVFPSLDEGFGLPVAESLSFGKLCVASSAAAIPEASQGLALHLDPRDVDAWRAAIGELCLDPVLLAKHERAIRAGFRRSTWDDAVRVILSAALGDGTRREEARAN